MPAHQVPKPLLAQPEDGLLFMAEAGGESIMRVVRRQLFNLRLDEGAAHRLEWCGEWLYTFTCRAPLITWPETSDTAAAILLAGRARHHVYCLIGLSGHDLVDTMIEQVRRRLTAYRVDAGLTRRIDAAFSRSLRDFEGPRDVQGNVHGKFSVADVLAKPGRISAIDLEQAGHGSLYLDAAYFLFQISMVSRWTPFGGDRRSSRLRRAFLRGRSPAQELDERLLDSFIAYYMANSFRPGDGLAGMTARAYARRWMEDWVRRVGV